MSVPRQLVEAFSAIKTSELAHGIITTATVGAFVDVLNRGIPAPTSTISYAIYRFVRGWYMADKAKFVAQIKGSEPYEALILWTDFDHILEHFSLTKKIFLGWDRNKNRYRGFVLTEDAPIQILRKGESLSPRKGESLSPRKGESLSPRKGESLSSHKGESLSPRKDTPIKILRRGESLPSLQNATREDAPSPLQDIALSGDAPLSPRQNCETLDDLLNALGTVDNAYDYMLRRRASLKPSAAI